MSKYVCDEVKQLIEEYHAKRVEVMVQFERVLAARMVTEGLNIRGAPRDAVLAAELVQREEVAQLVPLELAADLVQHELHLAQELVRDKFTREAWKHQQTLQAAEKLVQRLLEDWKAGATVDLTELGLLLAE